MNCLCTRTSASWPKVDQSPFERDLSLLQWAPISFAFTREVSVGVQVTVNGLFYGSWGRENYGTKATKLDALQVRVTPFI